jgi:hypothetical protein
MGRQTGSPEPQRGPFAAWRATVVKTAKPDIANSFLPDHITAEPAYCRIGRN